MDTIETLQIVVSGRVQGVGYRWFAFQAARKLKIEGTVRNLPNGDVEVFASGPKENLQTFLELLKDGPSFGYVTELKTNKVTPAISYEDFKIITR